MFDVLLRLFIYYNMMCFYFISIYIIIQGIFFFFFPFLHELRPGQPLHLHPFPVVVAVASKASVAAASCKAVFLLFRLVVRSMLEISNLN